MKCSAPKQSSTVVLDLVFLCHYLLLWIVARQPYVTYNLTIKRKEQDKRMLSKRIFSFKQNLPVIRGWSVFLNMKIQTPPYLINNWLENVLNCMFINCILIDAKPYIKIHINIKSKRTLHALVGLVRNITLN